MDPVSANNPNLLYNLATNVHDLKSTYMVNENMDKNHWAYKYSTKTNSNCLLRDTLVAINKKIEADMDKESMPIIDEIRESCKKNPTRYNKELL